MRVSPVLCSLLLLLSACTRVHQVPLQAGDYVSDDLNEPKTLSGIALTVDLAHASATLADGTEHVTLTLARERDPERWRPDCGTMSGHAMLETARISPTTFTIRGQHFSYDSLDSDCGAGVRLTQSNNHDQRWIFRPR